MTVSERATLWLLNVAIFGLALWFFGNLYEEIILMPNWLAAPIDVLRAYNRYYSIVIQYHYYVPLTQLAVVMLATLYFTRNPARQLARPALGRATVWGLLGIALTAYVVITINLHLFVGELTVSEAVAHRKGLVWMVLNGIRLAFVGLALGNAVRVRDALLHHPEAAGL